MSSFARLAGSGRRADGALVTWTVAEGGRGRRWRESVILDGALVHSLLYETDIDRRFSHLELATPSGLATLHPERDGTLHGNVVRPDGGVEHIVGFSFPTDAVLSVSGSPVTMAATLWTVGGDRSASVVELDAASLRLSLHDGPILESRPADPRGIPVLDDAALWLLELPEEG